MKLLRSVPLAVIASAALAFASGAYAAADSGKPKAPAAQTAQAAVGSVQPHSHVTERTGVTPLRPLAQQVSTAPGIDKDRSKHFHPRDK